MTTKFQAPAEGDAPSDLDWLDLPGAAAAWNRIRRAARALNPTGSIAETLNAAAALADLAFNVQPKGTEDPADLRFSWMDFQQIGDVPAVDEAVRNLLDDPTEDNSTCMVRAICEAAADRLVALAASPAVGEADAAPQAEREPLTKEQVFRALQAAAWPFPLPARNFDPLHFARAIERAHGIGEAQPPVQGNDK